MQIVLDEIHKDFKEKFVASPSVKSEGGKDAEGNIKGFFFRGNDVHRDAFFKIIGDKNGGAENGIFYA